MFDSSSCVCVCVCDDGGDGELSPVRVCYILINLNDNYINNEYDIHTDVRVCVCVCFNLHNQVIWILQKLR